MSQLLLPGDLSPYTQIVAECARIGAFVIQDPTQGESALGSTRNWGRPDVPLDGPVAQRIAQLELALPFVIQVNLAEIPPAARRPHVPTQGVVWAFFEADSEEWRTETVFDLRPAADISWAPRRAPIAAARWSELATYPQASESILPAIYYVRDVEQEYNDWWCGQRPHRGKLQVGGWIHPIQGIADDDAPLVAALEEQHFGDSGALYLHFDVETQLWRLSAMTH